MRVIYLLVFFVVFLPSILFSEEKGVNVKGIVKVEGEKEIKGTIAFFDKDYKCPPDPLHFTRVPDEVIELKGDGSFNGKVKDGKYYVGVLLNNTGKRGPLKLGDKFYFLKQDEKLLSIDLANVTSYDFGEIKLEPVEITDFKVKTAIMGKVVDEHNNPLEGVYVFAFSANYNSKKPLYVSLPTDKEGKFLLRVCGGDSYILRVRNAINSGPPKNGTVVGVYGGAEPKAISISDGEILRDIVIKAEVFGKEEKSNKKR